MMKKLLILTILFLFALSFSDSVFACSPAPQTVVLKCDIKDSLMQQDTTCINDDCSVNLSKNQYGELYLNIPDSRDRIYINERYGIELYDFYIQDDTLSYSQLLTYLDSICVEDLTDIRPIFDQEVQNWMSTKKGYFLGGDLIFEPYSTDRESELIESKNAFGNCHYEDFKKIGNWFVITETSRDYCHLTGGGGGMCPRITKSHLQFFGFILTNPNVNKLPYLFGYLIVICVASVFIVYLFKRKELKLVFKPNKFNIIEKRKLSGQDPKLKLKGNIMFNITEPRSWLGTFVMFFAGTALPFAILMTLLTGSPFSVSIFSGLFFGLFYAFIMAFSMKGETIKKQFTSKQDFMNKMNTRIAQIGYSLEFNSEGFYVYKPSVQAGLLAGRISITFNQKEATIVGPFIYVEKLRNI